MTYVLGDQPETLTLSPELAGVAGLLTSGGLIPRLKFHRVDIDD